MERTKCIYLLEDILHVNRDKSHT